MEHERQGFIEKSKHREESFTIRLAAFLLTIFDEVQGVWKADETLFDMSSQSKQKPRG